MKKKLDIITFKVDEDLGETIRDIPNRSEFIRQAIVAALGSVCPLCNGSGMLTPKQKEHWDDFAQSKRDQGAAVICINWTQRSHA